MNRDIINNLKSEWVAEKPQFDISLGGEEVVAQGLKVKTFTEHRMREITALSQAIEEPQHTTLIFQELPRHMRRRVMGHSSKRLPRLLREAHHNQLVKGSLIQPKKPNRKHKRRPGNLLEEFNRRQKTFVWLETHMWHAKRFHMMERWGYRLANHPNDRSHRACYRAGSRHCLLQDVSYLCCVELSGQVDSLIDGLSELARAECGLTFAAAAFLSGGREGSVTLFRRGTYPRGVLGHASFLWRPPGDGSDRSLWVWVHPASYPEVLEELIETFDLKRKDGEGDEGMKPPRVGERKRGGGVEKTKLETRNVPFTRTPKYENGRGVAMVLLKDTLNRLRLTGPLSQAVLKEALCVPRPKQSEPPITRAATELTPATDIDDIFALMSRPAIEPAVRADEIKPRDAGEHDWWSGFLRAEPSHRSASEAKADFWKSVTEKQSPAELPPNLVVGLTIVDPRLWMPAKRKKAVPDDRYLCEQPRQPAVLAPPPEASTSAIWCSRVRDVVSQTKLDVAELNARRKGNLVPGFTEEEREEVSTSDEHSRIPVLLLQRPGCREDRTGYGSGWDVVVPAGWAMPLWMAMVFRGARPGGQREASGLRREMCDVDLLAPDSTSGQRESQVRREELTEKHFRLPPAKRPNYIKLGISSPFSCPWGVLTREWASNVAPTEDDHRYFVLRDRKMLLGLRNAVGPQGTGLCPPCPPEYHRCLVPVSLTMRLRGTPQDFSPICVPTPEDLARLGSDPRYAGPQEPQHADDNEERRKTLRLEHQALMKRLRKQRVRAMKRIKDMGVIVERLPEMTAKERKKRLHKPCCDEAVDGYRETDRRLWLPECLAVRDRCSRVTVGFVERGAFSFARAGGAGVGYVPLPALVALATKHTGGALFVLVRNTTSYQYHFARLGVICPT